MPSKKCSRCLEDKDVSCFYKRAKSLDGLQAWCKECSLVSVKKYQKKLGKSIVHRSVRYGLTPDEVAGLMNIPACQSCGAAFSGQFEMKFDHCHEGGHFRGILCHLCNMACAGASDDVVLRLQKCIAYCLRDKERHEQARAG